MKEHRSKALRVTTPHSIESDDLDNKYHWCGCKDADNDDELFEMLQFDLVPSRGSDSGSGNGSDNGNFFNQHQQRRPRQQQQQQQQQRHFCDATGSGSYCASSSSWPSPTPTPNRIACTNDAAKYPTTASSCDVTPIKVDAIYGCSSYKFQNATDDRSYELTRGKQGSEEEEEEEEEEAEIEKNEGGGGGPGGSEPTGEHNYEMADCARQRRIHFANVDEKNLSQRSGETWHSRFAAACNRTTRKREKNFSPPSTSASACACLSSSSSSSSSTWFSHDDSSYSILDLVSGVDLSDNWPLKIQRIKEAISREKKKTQTPRKSCCSGSSSSLWYNLRDANGNTALLVSGQLLLKEGCFDKAVELATIFLSEGSDVNVFNYENRTLLSYSIQCMDESIRLTTLLVNYGANVWPMVASVELPLRKNRFSGQCGGGGSGVANEMEKYDVDAAGDERRVFGGRDGNNNSGGGGGGAYCNSAFTWFLITIIKRLKLTDHCLQTLYLLAEVMAERPDLMRSHVMSTMFSHAKCYSILGPVFLQIKLAMSPYWTQPPSLKYLCKSAIRKSILGVSGRFITAENVSATMLPPSLQSYLMLEN